MPSSITGAPGPAEPSSVQAIRAAETPLGAWFREKTPHLAAVKIIDEIYSSPSDIIDAARAIAND